MHERIVTVEYPELVTAECTLRPPDAYPTALRGSHRFCGQSWSWQFQQGSRHGLCLPDCMSTLMVPEYPLASHCIDPTPPGVCSSLRAARLNDATRAVPRATMQHARYCGNLAYLKPSAATNGMAGSICSHAGLGLSSLGKTLGRHDGAWALLPESICPLCG